TGLGFDTNATGKFDEPTRAVITRWQGARGYPKSGYLNKLQHKALLSEIVATTQTSSTDDDAKPAARARRSSPAGAGGSGAASARGQPAHLHFLACRNPFGAGDLWIIVVFGRCEFAGHKAGGIAIERIRNHDAGQLTARQNDAVERHHFRCRRRHLPNNQKCE